MIRASLRLTVAMAGFLWLSLTVAAQEASPRWQTIGPGGGGALFLPTISPSDPKRVLVSCDMTGAYISDDAGQSWRMFNLRGRIRFFVFDPHDASVIYAQTIGLWRSTDDAHTWQFDLSRSENRVRRIHGQRSRRRNSPHLWFAHGRDHRARGRSDEYQISLCWLSTRR